MTPIETARNLLADASPELRRAVGELVNYAMQQANNERGQRKLTDGGIACRVLICELIEKAGKQ